MFKKIKKVVAFALALTMLMGMSTVAFAAERESEVPELTKGRWLLMRIMTMASVLCGGLVMVRLHK